MSTTIRVIGDVHGKIGGLKNVMRAGAEYDRCVQIGDLGFESDYDRLERALRRSRTLPSPDAFSFVPGNHDDYENLPAYSLGDYGTSGPFFYARGATSIDRDRRTAGVDWFPDEEMEYTAMRQCVSAFREAQPAIALSHDGPKTVTSEMFRWMRDIPSRTATMLDRMLEVWRPQLWIFGHHHRTKKYVAGETTFWCLGELRALDVHVGDDGRVKKTSIVRF